MFKRKKDDPAAKLSWGSSADMHKALEALWPVDENGQRDDAAFLATIPDINNEADFKINMLMAMGIPAFKEYNSEGSLGKLIIGTSAYGASLFVPCSMLEDAKALLEDSAETLLEEEFSDAP